MASDSGSGSGSNFGSDSDSDEGRRAAVADVRAIFEQVQALRDARGQDAVVAVELHSAPLATPGASSAEALARSLSEIAEWDWEGVRLVLEHADARVDAHPPQKGWLPLGEELAASRLASTRSGVTIAHSINWGRSAIETRSADGPIDHLQTVIAAEALVGFMVSGASPLPTGRSSAWQDVHLGIDRVEPESLLTAAALDRAVATIANTELAYLGVKVGRAVGSTTAPERLAPGLATLHELDLRWTRR